MSRRGMSFLGVFGVLFFLSAVAWGDRRIAEGDVPKAVMDAVKAAVPGAEFLSGEVDEHHHHPPVYHLDVKGPGGIVHLHVTASGRVTRVAPGFRGDHDIPADQLPGPVKAALQKVRPNAEILEVELGHHHDQLVYEIQIAVPNGEDEIYISDTGDIVKLEAENHHERKHHHD